MKTRHVGPWLGASRNDHRRAAERTIKDWEVRSRRYDLAQRAYLEIWPEGTTRGDKRVRRTPPPRTPHLPPMVYRQSPNYNAGPRAIKAIVIHQTEGGYAPAVGWLCNPMAKVSAHIVVNESGDKATQLVAYRDIAWHARGHNTHTIGIELAGLSTRIPAESQLLAAARIVAYLCKRFNIRPVQGGSSGDNGIVAHNQLSGHLGNSDVNKTMFGWDKFLALVTKEHTIGFSALTWGK